jgi:hypothetical protein
MSKQTRKISYVNVIDKLIPCDLTQMDRLNQLPKTMDTMTEIDTSMKDCLVISNNIYACVKKILHEKEWEGLLHHAIKNAIHAKTLATWANMDTKLCHSIIKNKNLIFVETYKIIRFLKTLKLFDKM